MIITLGQARSAIAEYAGKSGKCADSEDVRLFVQEVVERLLYRGAHGNLRKWCFCLTNACFTAPADMEVPLKVKIDGYPEHVWSYWYEFHDIQTGDDSDTGYKPGLFEEVNPYCTIYDIPVGGARVAAVSLGDESGAYITVQGLDLNGREVFTTQDGVQVHGERIPIRRDNAVFTRTSFSKVTGIEKSRTSNYVRLYWQTWNFETNSIIARGLLGEYRPTDIHPSYRRFKVNGVRCDCPVRISVLGRVKLLDSYHNNDILPVTNMTALRRMAQAMQAEANDNVQSAQFHSVAVDNILEDENQYYRTGQEPFDFFLDTSPGSNENLQ